MIDNKLIVVILVLLIIFAGIILFLVNLERRISRMEKEWRERKAAINEDNII